MFHLDVLLMSLDARLFMRESLKYDGKPPPETRLYMGQVGGVLVPIGSVMCFISRDELEN